MKTNLLKSALFILLLVFTTLLAVSCVASNDATHTVTFTDEDGAVISSVTVNHGEKVQRPTTPTKPGSVFAGWYCGDSQWSFSSPIKEDVTIVAKWLHTTYTVSFNAGNSQTFENLTVNHGATITLPTPDPLDDHTFIGWYNGSMPWDDSKPVTSNINLNAVWRPNHLTVNLDPKNGTGAKTIVIEYGEKITEPSVPVRENAVFLGWYLGDAKWDFSTPVTENTTLTAKWQSEYVIVTFDTGDAATTEYATIRFNTSVEKPASDPIRDTYTFGGWYNGSLLFDFSTKITSDITLTAKWNEICVTVSFDTTGGTEIAPVLVHVGETLKAPQTPLKSSYFFDKWLLGGVPFDFTTAITEDITLTASWITEQDQRWRDYKQTLPQATYDSLKKLYDYYDGDSTVNWLAGLWDGNLGGFYYSNSARDYTGYLIDLESTKQAIGWMTANGLISNVNQLPNSMKLSMVEFAKSTQSSNDGYFYHPQWPQGTDKLQTDRYGRDLSWATGLINDLDVDTNGDGIVEDQYPNYCTPNGYKCKNHKFGGGSCSFPIASASLAVASGANSGITELLNGSSVTAAVSNVKSSYVAPTASVSDRPDYSSAEAFSAWLEAYNANIKVDSGHAHQLSALKDEIVARGYGNIVLDHLDRVQKEIYDEQIAAKQTPTGMWQKDINYRAVWGLLKYAAFYNSSACRREIKYALEMVDTAIKVILLPPDGEYFMNDLYNQWSSINSLISNVKYFSPTKLDSIYEKFRTNAPALIDNTVKKIEPFKTEGGGFGYTSTGNSLSGIYGVPISKGLVESDVNGTTLCCSLYRSVFTCLGYTVIPLCSSDDFTRFLEIANTPKPTESFSGSIPDSIKPTVVTSGYKLETVKDPKDSANKVLAFTSGVSSTNTSDRLTITTAQSSGKCFVFESDLYIDSSATSDGYIFQFNMGGAYMITLHKSGKTITIKETDSTQRQPTTTTATVSTDTWFTLRVEYYTHTSLGKSTPEIKIFINDKLSAESEFYYGKGDSKTPATQYNTVSIYSMKAFKTKILIDNCYFTAIDKDYSSTSHSTKDIVK